MDQEIAISFPQGNYLLTNKNVNNSTLTIRKMQVKATMAYRLIHIQTAVCLNVIGTEGAVEKSKPLYATGKEAK